MEFLIGVNGSANGDGVSGFFARKKATNPVPVGTPSLSKHPHISNTERSQKSVTFVSV